MWLLSWLMASQCKNVLEHHCFNEYDETKDFLNIDENFIATIGMNTYL